MTDEIPSYLVFFWVYLAGLVALLVSLIMSFERRREEFFGRSLEEMPFPLAPFLTKGLESVLFYGGITVALVGIAGAIIRGEVVGFN